MLLLLMHDNVPMQASPAAGAIVALSHSTSFITNGIPATEKRAREKDGFS